MYRNKKKWGEFYKISVGKRKGSITVECLALISIVLVVLGVTYDLAVERIREENNLWVSYGVNNLDDIKERKLLELHNILSNVENLEIEFREDRYYKSSVDNKYMVKYVVKENIFKMLDDGGRESDFNFKYEIINGCSCNKEGCLVINKGMIIKFLL